LSFHCFVWAPPSITLGDLIACTPTRLLKTDKAFVSPLFARGFPSRRPSARQVFAAAVDLYLNSVRTACASSTGYHYYSRQPTATTVNSHRHRRILLLFVVVFVVINETTRTRLYFTVKRHRAAIDYYYYFISPFPVPTVRLSD